MPASDHRKRYFCSQFAVLAMARPSRDRPIPGLEHLARGRAGWRGALLPLYGWYGPTFAQRRIPARHSAIEHKCVLAAGRAAASRHGLTLETIPVTTDGVIDLDAAFRSDFCSPRSRDGGRSQKLPKNGARDCRFPATIWIIAIFQEVSGGRTGLEPGTR
jgi:hypothetical protein